MQLVRKNRFWLVAVVALFSVLVYDYGIAYVDAIYEDSTGGITEKLKIFSLAQNILCQTVQLYLYTLSHACTIIHVVDRKCAYYNHCL